MSSAPLRQPLSPATCPYLPRHILFRHDPVRERWVLLAPERVLAPEPTAVAILQLLDGQRSIADIAAELAQIYAAPADLIAADAIEMLQDLADRGFVRVKPSVIPDANAGDNSGVTPMGKTDD